MGADYESVDNVGRRGHEGERVVGVPDAVVVVVEVAFVPRAIAVSVDSRQSQESALDRSQEQT